MALNREDRYPTGTALADDLQHWLADEPVSAYPERRLERAARWIRRHKAAALSTTAGLLLLALVSTVGVVLVNHQRQISGSPGGRKRSPCGRRARGKGSSTTRIS